MGKNILITGFDPFDKDATNPSGDWITWMRQRQFPSQISVHGAILPVTFSGAFAELKKHFDEVKPDIVIMTGLAKNRTMLTAERIGINWVDARIPDNDGVTIKSQKIDETGPDGLFSTIDIERMITLAEKAGVPMKLSTSAGEYVCNDLLYKVLCFLKDKNVPATFIHIPGLHSAETSYNGIYLALESIVYSL